MLLILGFVASNQPIATWKLREAFFESYKTYDADSLFTVTRNNQKLAEFSYAPFCNRLIIMIGQRSQDLEPLFFF
jgi:hypothetical protein